MEHSFRAIAAAAAERTNPAWSARVEQLKDEERQQEARRDRQNAGRLTPKAVIEAINRHKPRGTVIATDVGQHQMWTAQYARFDRTRRIVSSGGLGTMGFGLGAAIGARVATGDPVVLVTGDGSFGMNLTELATAVSYELPIVIVLMNNGVLGMVRQWQTLFFDKRYSATQLGARKTDFVKVAEAFGAEGIRVDSAQALDSALEYAFSCGRTVVIDTLIDKDEMVFPMLPAGGSIEDMITDIKRGDEK